MKRTLILTMSMLIIAQLFGCEWRDDTYTKYVTENHGLVKCPPGRVLLDDLGNRYLELDTMKCYRDRLEVLDAFKACKPCVDTAELENEPGDTPSDPDDNDGDAEFNEAICSTCQKYVQDDAVCRRMQAFELPLYNPDDPKTYQPGFIGRPDIPASADEMRTGLCPAQYSVCVFDAAENSQQYGCVGDPNCTEGTQACNHICVDVQSDVNNCGRCGNSCIAGISNSVAASCIAGECFVNACEPGFHPNAVDYYIDASGELLDYTPEDPESYTKIGAKTVCERDDERMCGGIDCRTTAGWGTGGCSEDQKCFADKCAPGFHMFNRLDDQENIWRACVADSVEACGDSEINCAKYFEMLGNPAQTEGVELYACVMQDIEVETTTPPDDDDPINGEDPGNNCAPDNIDDPENGCMPADADDDPGDDEPGDDTPGDDTPGDDTPADNGRVRMQVATCVVSKCAKGYHWNRENDGCEPNSTTACGSFNNNCYALAGWVEDDVASNICTNDFQCQAETCDSGYHKYNELNEFDINIPCEPNTKDNCGRHGNQCHPDEVCDKSNEGDNALCSDKCSVVGTTNCNSQCVDITHNPLHCGACNRACNVSNSVSSTCVNGNCIATGCRTGYHLYDGACEIHSTANCGVHGTACNASVRANGTAFSCSTGICVATECKTGYHKYNNGCEAHTNSNCGSHGIKCTKTNATTVSCSTGVCKATACKTGYHKYNNGCEANTNSNCGSHGTKCTKANATTVSCSTGVCKATACKSGYHKYNNGCEANSKNNCGSHGHVCKKSCNTKTGKCT